MSIESPGTYGEWYWKNKVDADTFFGDETESVLSPVAAELINTLPGYDKLPEAVKSFLSQLTAPSSFAWGTILSSLGGGVANNVLGNALGTMLKPFNYEMNQLLQDTRLDPLTASTLYARKKIEREYWLEAMTSAGFDQYNSDYVYRANFPFPTIPELILWSRYNGDPENVWSTLYEKFDIDPTDFKVWEWLGLQRLTTDQCQSLLKREFMTEQEFYDEVSRIGWSGIDRDYVKELTWILPNAMLLVQSGLLHDMRTEDILQKISRADIHPDYAQDYLDAVLTKPAPQDLIAFHLRKDPQLSDLSKDLARIGIHPNYTAVYETLAYQIPPVADIITMAVREAFTPAIAARFGQYEDFPEEFEKYAAMKGLDPEWSRRYWAAHWSLPSAMQGFEMLHRGIITEQDLNLLLRALDVMPFWREKLIQMAYKPLTRVDVRRMYKEGVLNEREVYEAYLDLGYNTENAQRMADFTVRQTLSSLSKFTTADVVKAYTERMISETFAISLLREMGIRSEDARYIVNTAEYKRQWSLTNDRIAGVKNLYKRGEYEANKARAELSRLNLPAEQIDVLMEQWYFEEQEKETPTWTTAQTLSFVKKGLITESRGVAELSRIGYDQEHINVYMRSISDATE